MKRLPLNQPNFTVRRERDRRAFSNLALLLFCGLVLAGGFVFAAGQHFAAVRYGYQSEELRAEHERLIEEQHRLKLERQQAMSPERLEKEALEIGMQPVSPAQLETRRVGDALPPPATVLVNPTASLRR